jgi:hypothetical protein
MMAMTPRTAEVYVMAIVEPSKHGVKLVFFTAAQL